MEWMVCSHRGSTVALRLAGPRRQGERAPGGCLPWLSAGSHGLGSPLDPPTLNPGPPPPSLYTQSNSVAGGFEWAGQVLASPGVGGGVLGLGSVSTSRLPCMDNRALTCTNSAVTKLLPFSVGQLVQNRGSINRGGLENPLVRRRSRIAIFLEGRTHQGFFP